MTNPTSSHPSTKAVMAARIAARTARSDDGCLVWTGGSTPGGYGCTWDGTKQIYSHRAVWAMENGPIPRGMQVDHLCFNRACCEISHLRLTTPTENQQHRRGAQGNSTTGYRGVYLTRGKFEARVQANNRVYYGGRFSTAEEANVSATALRVLHHI